jgi:hypothetical protein
MKHTILELCGQGHEGAACNRGGARRTSCLFNPTQTLLVRTLPRQRRGRRRPPGEAAAAATVRKGEEAEEDPAATSAEEEG